VCESGETPLKVPSLSGPDLDKSILETKSSHNGAIREAFFVVRILIRIWGRYNILGKDAFLRYNEKLDIGIWAL